MSSANAEGEAQEKQRMAQEREAQDVNAHQGARGPTRRSRRVRHEDTAVSASVADPEGESNSPEGVT